MKRFAILILLVLISTCSCSHPKMIKLRPEFSTDIKDPEIKRIVREYFDLSTYYDISFKNKVSIGFSTIDRESAIGMCTYGGYFREIDIDADYWSKATWPSKIALLYHELTHCYCGRPHDFGKGTAYPDNSLKYITQIIIQKMLSIPENNEGYLSDGCPESIMHPTIVSNSCFESHYGYYIEEMFARCRPY